MEDFLGWILVVALVVLPVLFVWSAVKVYRRHKIKQAQEEAAREERIKQATAQWKKQYTGATHVGKTTYDYNLDKSRTTVTERDTGRKMSYVHENDSGPDLLTTALIANMLFNNKDSSAGTVSWKDDVPSVSTKEESTFSWGLDDSDSRKSASNSFGSSDSSSSWDSGSSSSDSGPSSDW